MEPHVRLTATAVALVLASSAAFAADQPKFVPFVIDESQFNDIRNYLLSIDIPAKWTYPVLSRLDQLEHDAQERMAAARAAAATKPVTEKNAP